MLKKEQLARDADSMTAPLGALSVHFNKLGFRSLVPDLSGLFPNAEQDNEKGFSGQDIPGLGEKNAEPKQKSLFFLPRDSYSQIGKILGRDKKLTPEERRALEEEWVRVRKLETTPDEDTPEHQTNARAFSDASYASLTANSYNISNFNMSSIFFNNNRNQNLPSVSVFTGNRPLPTTVGECSQCSNGVFLSAVLAAEEACEDPVQALKGATASSLTEFETDTAWSRFCASDCFKKLARIPSTHYCCLGENAPSFLNLLTACQASTQQRHSSRYCGAELSNLLVVGCNYSAIYECQADDFCEWDVDHSQCLFKATQENLDYVCTECNHRYFAQFPAGGMYNLTVHAALGGVYGAFCNKVDGQYCLLSSAAIGYRMAQNATASEIDEMCQNDPDSLRNRLCHRIIAVRAADSIRRNALETWKTCNVSAAADQDCDYQNAATLMLAYTVEKSAMLACAFDPITDSNCINRVMAIRKEEPCAVEVMESFECTARCDQKTRAAALKMGCCGSTVGTGGIDIARRSPYSSRYVIGTMPYGLSRINNQSWVSTPGVNRPARTNSDWVILEDRVSRLSESNSMSGYSNCSTFVEYKNWSNAYSSCTRSPARRTYYVRLKLNWKNLNTCQNKDFVYSALKSDIGAITGITRSQMTQVYISEDRGVTFLMEGSKAKVTGTTMALSITSDSDAFTRLMDQNIENALAENRFIFPTAAVEIMTNCPNVLPNKHSPLLFDMFAVRIAGETDVTAKLKNEAPRFFAASAVLGLMALTLAIATLQL